MKPTRDADDSEATQSEGEDEETETESENGPELFRPPPAAAQRKGAAAAASRSRPQQRLGAARHTPAAVAPPPPRPTSRQLGLLPRWSEMDLPKKLTYSYKGTKGAAGGHVTEEERERRRVQAQMEKAEAEEAVKSRIRRAVSTRFQGRMQGPDGGGTPWATSGRAAAAQATPIQPAWVRVRAAAAGVSVAWHPAAHPLSLPMAVRTDASSCLEPIDLQLQAAAGGGQQWRAPPGSSIQLGCELHLQPSRQPGSGGQQQPVLQCVDAHGGVVVGCLLQEQVLDALETAGYLDVLEQQQSMTMAQPPPAAAEMDWQRWRAVVRSAKHAAGDTEQLTGVTVRLLLTL